MAGIGLNCAANLRTRLLGTLLFAGVCGLAEAAEITFTGADAANPTNLSSAANWSAAPTAETVGVINLGMTSALGFVVNADMALAGLKVTGNAGKNIEIGGAGTLTLGASGYESTANGNLTLRCRVQTAEEQTWNVAKASLYTYGEIVGSAKLTITNYTYLHHNASVNHGGDIHYYSNASADNRWVSYRGDGRWAKDVYVHDGRVEIMRPSGSADVKWSSIFPEGTLKGDANPKLLSTGYSSSGKVIFEEGDTFVAERKWSYTSVGGTFEQRGGSMAFSDQYYLMLGNYSYDGRWGFYYPHIYNMKGGTMQGAFINIGYNTADAWGNMVRFDQTGGSVTLGINVDYGAGINIGGGGNQCRTYAVAEYLMGGGTLRCNGYGNSLNLGLCSPKTSNYVTPAALYTQTNGTTTTHWISIGEFCKFWNEGPSPVIFDGYARFELTGGTFEIDNNTMLKVHEGWNNSTTKPNNSVYDFRFGGGTFILPENKTWPLACYIEKNGNSGTSFGEKDRSLKIEAPVSGPGKIVKNGTGALVLTDATRFTGTLDVRGGTVTISGGEGGIDNVDNCFKWTADSLAGSLADGAEVVNWTDDNMGTVATTNGCKFIELDTQKRFKPPKFKANAYNGHAALNFTDYGALCVPKASNPLYGQSNCTVVAVLKPNAGINGGMGGTVYYSSVFLSCMPATSYSYFAMSLNDNGFGAARYFQGDVTPSDMKTSCRQGLWYSPGSASLANKVHAIACSVDVNGITATVDGYYTNKYWTVFNRVSPIGWGNLTWKCPNDAQLEIGQTYLTDNTSRFQGDMLELRIYTNRVFTVEEQRAITRSLVEKYDGTASAIARVENATSGSMAKCGLRGGFTTWTAPAAPVADLAWSADSIDGEEGDVVDAWTTADGSATAVAVAGKGAPTLVKNVVAGHAAVRFSRDDKTLLDLDASKSPFAGKSSFAAAVVWRSVTPTLSGSSITAMDNVNQVPVVTAGLVSTKLANTKEKDFSLGTIYGDAVSVSYGNAAGDQGIATRKPCRLNDGDAHITVFTADGDGKAFRLMTDGVFHEGTLVNVTVQDLHDVIFGARRRNAVGDYEFFTGDILEIKLYGRTLTKAEMTDLGENWAAKYNRQLLVGSPFTADTVRAIGLGATNVIVAAGARLSLPLSDAAPYTLKAGSRLSGAGDFLGSYRLTAGSVLDIASEKPYVDDLQLVGGAIRTSISGSSPAGVRRLKISGSATIEIADGASVDPSVRLIPIVTYEAAEIDPDVTWTVKGLGNLRSEVVVNEATRTLCCKVHHGLLMIVR